MAAATALALFLGLLDLGQESLWYDESVSFLTVTQGGWGGPAWSVEPDITFYYRVLDVAAAALGTTEFALRLPSVLFAAASVPLVAAIAARIYGPRTALIAAGLLATSAFALRYAQEARAYALALFLTCLSTLLFLRALDSPASSPWRWGAWALASAAAVWAHLFAGFVIVAQAVALAARPQRPPVRVLIGSAVMLAALVAPLALQLSGERADRVHPAPVSWDAVRAVVETIAGGPWLGWALLAVGAGGLAAAILERRRSDRGPQSWQLVLVAGWLVLPIAIAALLSLEQPVFRDRYLIVALPGAVLLGAAGLSRLRPWPVLGAGLAAVVALSVVRIDDHYDSSKEDWRSAGAIIAERAVPGDMILLAPYVFPSLDYYYAPDFPKAETPIYAAWTEPQAFAGRRVWLVRYHRWQSEELVQARSLVRDGRVAVSRTDLKLIRVELWEPRAGEATAAATPSSGV